MYRSIQRKRVSPCLWATAFLLATALLWTGCGDGHNSAETEVNNVTIKAGPDGAEIRAPGVDIKAGPDGTQVSAPGVDIKAGPQGAEVSAPSVKVQAGRDGVTTGVAGPVSNGADSQPQN